MLNKGALALAELIRRRELSPTEVVEAHLARIDQVNPKLNAVVARRDEAARSEARRADQAVMQREPLGPLHGVPFTTKEMIAVEGMPWTCGSTLRCGITAARDAEVIRRLRRAGAILLGVTNVPEMGFWMETDNCVYGRTNNPHDPRRTPGGSSGGEAAIVAAGGSAFGIGSDGAGSIRMPALFCGLFGHKPTGGLVPIRGHYPFDPDDPPGGVGDTQRFIAIGPLTRRATDLKPLLEILSGTAVPEVPRRRTVLVLDDPRIRWTSRASAEMRQVVNQAADVLARNGAYVTVWNHESIRYAVDIWQALFEDKFGRMLEDTFGQGQPMALLTELLRSAMRRPRHTLPTLMFCFGERINRQSKHAVARFIMLAQELRKDLEAALDGGVLIMPAHPRAAPRHGWPILRPLDFAYTALWNALELPATSVPIGQSRTGLPLGIQVVGARGGDASTIAAAELLERCAVLRSPSSISASISCM